MHENIVEELLEVIGFSGALVTDESQFSDFFIADEEAAPKKEKLKKYIKDNYNLEINIRDKIGETALKIHRYKNANSTIH